jgi:hypothetical protein
VDPCLGAPRLPGLGARRLRVAAESMRATASRSARPAIRRHRRQQPGDSLDRCSLHPQPTQ